MESKLPEGWGWKKVKEVCLKITSGGTPLRKNLAYYNGNIPWVKSGDLNDNYLSHTQETITEEGLTNSSAKIFPKGTVLIALYGATIGKTAILNIEAATNQACCGLIVNERKILNKYLFYFLRSRINEYKKSGFGGAQDNISQGLIKKTEIPIPFPNNTKKSLEVQQVIVKKLDAFFKEYDILKEEKQKAKEKRELIYPSALFKLLEKYRNKNKIKIGELVNNGSILEIKSGFPSGKHTREGELIHIRPMNINLKGRLDLSKCKYVNPDPDKKETYKLRKGDIIFNNTNSPELVGKTMCFNSDANCLYSNHMTRIRVDKEKINPNYLAIYLHNLWRQGFFKIICRSHVSQASVNNSMLKDVEIILPSIKEQDKIVEQMNNISKPMSMITKESISIIKNIESLPHSVLTKAFQGELISG